jgi:hypothetical protein
MARYAWLRVLVALLCLVAELELVEWLPPTAQLVACLVVVGAALLLAYHVVASVYAVSSLAYAIALLDAPPLGMQLLSLTLLLLAYVVASRGGSYLWYPLLVLVVASANVGAATLASARLVELLSLVGIGGVFASVALREPVLYQLVAFTSLSLPVVAVVWASDTLLAIRARRGWVPVLEPRLREWLAADRIDYLSWSIAATAGLLFSPLVAQLASTTLLLAGLRADQAVAGLTVTTSILASTLLWRVAVHYARRLEARHALVLSLALTASLLAGVAALKGPQAVESLAVLVLGTGDATDPLEDLGYLVDRELVALLEDGLRDLAELVQVLVLLLWGS